MTVAVPGFVPIDSGGTARVSHPLPLLRSYNRQHNRREGQSLSSSLTFGPDACGRPHSYGTIRRYRSRSFREEGVASWHLCARFAKRSRYRATTSVMPTIRRGGYSIRTFKPFAPWSARATSVSVCAPAACVQDWSGKRSESFSFHHNEAYGAPQRTRPPRSTSLMTDGSSGDRVKVRLPSLLLRTSPTSPLASNPRPARAFPVASSSKNSSAFTPLGFCASTDRAVSN
jgi:hypothetical protein